jgi:hypothetical protein
MVEISQIDYHLPTFLVNAIESKMLERNLQCRLIHNMVKLQKVVEARTLNISFLNFLLSLSLFLFFFQR